jgi:hypothetical protein
VRKRPWKRYAATTAIIVGGLYTGYHYGYGTESTPSGFTANLYISESAGTTTCVRSASLKTYDQALAGNNVCKGSSASYSAWEKGCAAATGGDVVGVTPGVYTPAVSGQDWLLGGNLLGPGGDCSDNLGADYDPNWREKGDAEASRANWVTFAPSSTSGCPNISLARPGNLGYGDWHLRVVGGCFNFNRTLIFTHGGVASGDMGNISFEGTSASDTMDMYGLEIRGCGNCLFKHIDYGPNVQCAANDSNATPAYFRCDPSGAYFESIFATNGTNSPGCTPAVTALCAGYFNGGSPAGNYEFVELYIHSGANTYSNIRLEGVRVHDGQAKGNGAGVHPGCIMFDGINGIGGLPAHNLVLDGFSCERQVIGIIHQDSGVTVQNSYFGCPVLDLTQTSPQGKWDVCSSGQPSAGIACWRTTRPSSTVPCSSGGMTNVLYRYNVFFGGTAMLMQENTSNFGDIQDVDVVANIFMGTVTGCSLPGVTCENNAFFGAGAVGSDPWTLTCDPTVDSDQSTSDDLWRDSTQLDPRLNGSSCGVPTLDPSALGADYQLGFDIDGDARGSTSTHAGAEN